MSYEHLGKLHTCCQCLIRVSVHVDPLIRNLNDRRQTYQIALASVRVTINMARYEVFLRIGEAIMFG